MRIRQRIVDQLCAATCGLRFYIGRNMQAAHQGPGISEAGWDASVHHVVATLDGSQVPPAEREGRGPRRRLRHAG